MKSKPKRRPSVIENTSEFPTPFVKQLERMAVRLGALNSEVAELRDMVKRLERANKKLQAADGSPKPKRRRGGGRRRTPEDAAAENQMDREFTLICK